MDKLELSFIIDGIKEEVFSVVTESIRIEMLGYWQLGISLTKGEVVEVSRSIGEHMIKQGIAKLVL